MAATPLDLLDSKRAEPEGCSSRLRLGVRTTLRRLRCAARPGGAAAAFELGAGERRQGSSGRAHVGAGQWFAVRRRSGARRATAASSRCNPAAVNCSAILCWARPFTTALAQRRDRRRCLSRTHGIAQRPLHQPVAPRPRRGRRGGVVDRYHRVAPDAGLHGAAAAAVDQGRAGRRPRAPDSHAAWRPPCCTPRR